MSGEGRLRAEIMSLREEIAELKKQLGTQLPVSSHACCLHAHWCTHHWICCCGGTRVCPVHGYTHWCINTVTVGGAITYNPYVTTSVASGVASTMYTISNGGYTSSSDGES